MFHTQGSLSHVVALVQGLWADDTDSDEPTAAPEPVTTPSIPGQDPDPETGNMGRSVEHHETSTKECMVCKCACVASETNDLAADALVSLACLQAPCMNCIVWSVKSKHDSGGLRACGRLQYTGTQRQAVQLLNVLIFVCVVSVCLCLLCFLRVSLCERVCVYMCLCVQVCLPDDPWSQGSKKGSTQGALTTPPQAIIRTIATHSARSSFPPGSSTESPCEPPAATESRAESPSIASCAYNQGGMTEGGSALSTPPPAAHIHVGNTETPNPAPPTTPAPQSPQASAAAIDAYDTNTSHTAPQTSLPPQALTHVPRTETSHTAATDTDAGEAPPPLEAPNSDTSQTAPTESPAHESSRASEAANHVPTAEPIHAVASATHSPQSPPLTEALTHVPSTETHESASLDSLPCDAHVPELAGVASISVHTSQSEAAVHRQGSEVMADADSVQSEDEWAVHAVCVADKETKVRSTHRDCHTVSYDAHDC